MITAFSIRLTSGSLYIIQDCFDPDMIFTQPLWPAFAPKLWRGFLGLKSGTWCSVGRFRNKHFNYLGVLHFSLRGYWTEFQCISQSIIIHLSLPILNWSLIWPRLPRLALKSVHIHLKHSILVHSTDTMFRVQDTPNHGNMKKWKQECLYYLVEVQDMVEGHHLIPA